MATLTDGGRQLYAAPTFRAAVGGCAVLRADAGLGDGLVFDLVIDADQAFVTSGPFVRRERVDKARIAEFVGAGVGAFLADVSGGFDDGAVIAVGATCVGAALAETGAIGDGFAREIGVGRIVDTYQTELAQVVFGAGFALAGPFVNGRRVISTEIAAGFEGDAAVTGGATAVHAGRGAICGCFGGVAVDCAGEPEAAFLAFAAALAKPWQVVVGIGALGANAAASRVFGTIKAVATFVGTAAGLRAIAVTAVGHAKEPFDASDHGAIFTKFGSADGGAGFLVGFWDFSARGIELADARDVVC